MSLTPASRLLNAVLGSSSKRYGFVQAPDGQPLKYEPFRDAKGEPIVKTHFFTGENVYEGGYFRLIALKDFGRVKKGDLGGLVETPKVLPQQGTSWIFPSGMADHKTIIEGNAQLSGEAYGPVKLKGNAVVEKGAVVADHSVIEGTVGPGAIIRNSHVPAHVAVGAKATVAGMRLTKDVATGVTEMAVTQSKGKLLLPLEPMKIDFTQPPKPGRIEKVGVALANCLLAPRGNPTLPFPKQNW